MFRYKIDDSVMIYSDGHFYFGRVTGVDDSNYPYEVTFSDGSRNWFSEDELVELIERP